MNALVDLSNTPWRRIWLSERDGIWCLVDAIDYEWLTAPVLAGGRAMTWNVSWGSRTPWQKYAKRNTGADRATVRMHREIMLRADPDGYGHKLVVDHINGQTLDNRRANLRWATAAQNRMNMRERDQIPSLDSIVARLLADLPAAAPGARSEILEDIPF